ncbi:carbohydrate kinase [Planococcus plakortidis]|uniref:Carbohydrate kinase n=1 Tax=Planococcus plakortidis TaxID=1038856 RepID=A0A1C7E8V5_9BACL|nr:carbohydrate kinase [Planococcus plakortidis]ANU20121.1 carbohydrate kinase [Planococcus plakortidis]
MGKLFSIGEILVDFIPHQKGIALKDVESFTRVPGGAPANVAAAVAKFGGTSSLITKVGKDAFGDFLLERLAEVGVKTDKIARTKQANTGLAFVSLRGDGERDFSFYRNPSADLLLEASEVDDSWFGPGDVLHFGSVDLVDSPMKKAHVKAIMAAKTNGAIISFDPNVRLPLWDNPKQCRETIQEFIPTAHILKVADDELEFITGIADESVAIASLFTGDVLAVVLTKGAKGADLHLQNETYTSAGYSVKVEDTTGAGDAFTGAFLHQLLKLGAGQDNVEALLKDHHGEILAFANASGALATTGKGAISSLPTKDEVLELMK